MILQRNEILGMWTVWMEGVKHPGLTHRTPGLDSQLWLHLGNKHTSTLEQFIYC